MDIKFRKGDIIIGVSRSNLGVKRRIIKIYKNSSYIYEYPDTPSGENNLFLGENLYSNFSKWIIS